MSDHRVSFFAIFSDIHGNIDALSAVLADTDQFPVRGMFCLGDIVGYGPEPASCVQRVMDTCAITVLGNHEAMLFLADKILDEDWDITISKPILLARDQLSKKQSEWLRSQSFRADVDPLTLSHASLHQPPEFHYIYTQEEASAHFSEQPTFISFNGHTHVPAIWEETKPATCQAFHPTDQPVRLDPAKRYSINVGSVGQPRDEDPRASYMLYDFENRVLLHRRVAYDLPRARARFKKAGLPQRNASRLVKGQ
ncbi:MAG: metallophosphoesterase family protein [Spartobacteria bacterium]